MAQESSQINKNLLKHLRNQKGETQDETANACFVSPRQYQNIERNGCTTTKVIQSIAKHFGISPKELSTNINEDNSLWYITNSDLIVGEVAKGYYTAIDDIKNLAKRYADIVETQLTIIDGTQVKTITIDFCDQEFTWSIRPIELNEKIGLVWTELSDWQQDTWENIRETLLYSCVEKVCLDGNPLVPEDVTPKFIVEFIEFDPRKIIHTGYRIFNSAAEFRVSFSQWLETIPMFVEPTHFDLGALNMTYGFKDEMKKAIRIYKVWVNQSGESIRAPWSAANIEKLITAITDRKRGGQNWALPIGVNENFDGEEITPFEPDVTYKKVTELPEIDFVFAHE
jgi:transcriptional regulator with XRE-family HTH domain